MHSPTGSRTGSFCHGVRRKKKLLFAQVAPAPLSLTTNPPAAFPITLIHGAGGSVSPSSLTSYSCLSLNPPIPLNDVSPEPSGADTMLFRLLRTITASAAGD